VFLFGTYYQISFELLLVATTLSSVGIFLSV